MRGMAGDLQQSLGALIQQGKVRVTQSRRGIAVEISDSVLFTSAKADLQPQSIAALRAVADSIKNTDNLIQVEGNTDNQPIRSPQYRPTGNCRRHARRRWCVCLLMPAWRPAAWWRLVMASFVPSKVMTAKPAASAIGA